jgi:hypothetical protein
MSEFDPRNGHDVAGADGTGAAESLILHPKEKSWYHIEVCKLGGLLVVIQAYSTCRNEKKMKDGTKARFCPIITDSVDYLCCRTGDPADIHNNGQATKDSLLFKPQ